MGLCQSPDCIGDAKRGDYCYACAKRRQRKARGEDVSLRPLQRPKTQADRLREAALRYAESDSEDDEEFERNWDSLRKSALAYVASLKKAWESNDPRGWLRKIGRKRNALVGTQGELFQENIPGRRPRPG